MLVFRRCHGEEPWLSDLENCTTNIQSTVYAFHTVFCVLHMDCILQHNNIGIAQTYDHNKEENTNTNEIVEKKDIHNADGSKELYNYKIANNCTCHNQ